MCQLSDKFYSAVRALSGDGPVKQRLLTAYRDNLALLKDDAIPDSIAEPFGELRRAVHAVRPQPSECPVTASIRKMSAAEATRHATSIVAMFSELIRVKATGERVSASAKAATDKPARRAPRHATLN